MKGDRYSVFDEGMEINAYYLSKGEALELANDLFDEGAEEVSIINMEFHLIEQEIKNDVRGKERGLY